jgi:hypothetical protein
MPVQLGAQPLPSAIASAIALQFSSLILLFGGVMLHFWVLRQKGGFEALGLVKIPQSWHFLILISTGIVPQSCTGAPWIRRRSYAEHLGMEMGQWRKNLGWKGWITDYLPKPAVITSPQKI